MRPLWLLPVFPLLTSAALLNNVSESVFGNDGLQSLPLAFGDFNADKLTDVIVLVDGSEDASKIGIMLAKPQTFSLDTGTYFDPLTSSTRSRTAKLVCTINNRDVVAALPSDFDGDGGMDVVVVTKEIGSEAEDGLEAMVLWGHHEQDKKVHRLICPEEAAEKGWSHKLHMNAHPIILDANGDNIADLFSTVSSDSEPSSERTLWLFPSNRSEAPETVTLSSELEPLQPLRTPHSNAFVDLNTDGNADLLVSAEDGFELWEDVGGHQESHFKWKKRVPYPRLNCDREKGNCIGQSVFADFDLDGHLDMIFPGCDNKDCATSSLYFGSMSKLWNEKPKEDFFLSLPIDIGEYSFDVQNGVSGQSKNDHYLGLTARVGDINLDGYPDLLIRVKHKLSGRIQMHLLLNIEDTESPTPGRRGFKLQEQIMSGLNNTVMATFYDLYENGLPDIIAVERERESGKLKIGAFTNLTQDSDAYFVKVIVLSGVCYHDCRGGGIQVPYGTNMPGQTVCYRTQRQVGEEFREVQSCAPQLPLSGHHALNLPYTIFGLGLAPNFLDYMYVNVTNATDVSRDRIWPQIIPNAQISVIPYPPNSPTLWQNKLFITPSKGITLTGLALVGTCAFCTFVIILFHLRERRMDRKEKLQEANRFHFDAM